MDLVGVGGECISTGGKSLTSQPTPHTTRQSASSTTAAAGTAASSSPLAAAVANAAVTLRRKSRPRPSASSSGAFLVFLFDKCMHVYRLVRSFLSCAF